MMSLKDIIAAGAKEGMTISEDDAGRINMKMFVEKNGLVARPRSIVFKSDGSKTNYCILKMEHKCQYGAEYSEIAGDEVGKCNADFLDDYMYDSRFNAIEIYPHDMVILDIDVSKNENTFDGMEFVADFGLGFGDDLQMASASYEKSNRRSFRIIYRDPEAHKSLCRTRSLTYNGNTYAVEVFASGRDNWLLWAPSYKNLYHMINNKEPQEMPEDLYNAIYNSPEQETARGKERITKTGTFNRYEGELRPFEETSEVLYKIKPNGKYEDWRDIRQIMTSFAKQIGTPEADTQYSSLFEKWTKSAKEYKNCDALKLWDYDKSRVHYFLGNNLYKLAGLAPPYREPEEPMLSVAVLPEPCDAGSVAGECAGDAPQGDAVEQKKPRGRPRKETPNRDHLQPYSDIKAEFEQIHAKIINSSCFIKHEGANVQTFKRADMRSSYEHMQVREGCFIDLWMKDPNIRKYERMDFLPENCPDNVFNLFRGFAYQRDEQKEECEALKFILNHIRILCSNDDATYDYFMHWLADIICNPARICGVAIIMKSIQGAGKNMFLEWLGDAIIGSDHYFTTGSAEQIFGKHSVAMRHRLLINLDETSSRDTFEHSNKLKNLITATTVQYEAKNINTITIRNYARWIFTTNNDVPVKIEEGDRRFVAIECSNEKCNNTAYFRKLAKTMKTPGLAYTFASYLIKEFNTDDYDFIGMRPDTGLYGEIKEACASSVNVFMFENINSIVDMLMPKETIMNINDIWALYRIWRDKTNYGDAKQNISGFTRALKRIGGLEFDRSGGTRVIINDGGKAFRSKIGPQFIKDDNELLKYINRTILID